MELIVGGALFWLFFIALIVVLEISVVNDTHFGVVFLLVFFGALAWLSTFNVFAWVWHNPFTLLWMLGVYALIGLGYSFVKWYFHLKNAKDNLEPHLAMFRTAYDTDKIRERDPFKGTFVEYLISKNQIPIAKENKWEISIWMAWWPFSMFWTLLHDVLRRFWIMLVNRYMFVFDKINQAVFGHLN